MVPDKALFIFFLYKLFNIIKSQKHNGVTNNKCNLSLARVLIRQGVSEVVVQPEKQPDAVDERGYGP